jgi:hypothetical protein
MYNLKPVSFGTSGNRLFSSNEIAKLDVTLLQMIRVFNYYWEDHPVDKYVFEQTDNGKLKIKIDGFNLITNEYEFFVIEEDEIDELFPYKEITLTLDECDDYYMGVFDLNKIT